MPSTSNISASAEGYWYDVDKDIIAQGLPAPAVRPSSQKTTSSYNVIVIGAGFTGLAAARDLSMAEITRYGLIDGLKFTINAYSSPNKSSFLNIVRLLALSTYNFNTFIEICSKYKLKDRTMSLVLAIFNEYIGDTLFRRTIKSVPSNTRGVEVTTKADFLPPLLAVFKTIKHTNFIRKVYIYSATPIEL
ncbi:hypothetical protein GQ44DRAFT_733650 [Phaeosphaeriaceae sp. PMI808]|nr:hypothetical protein GQ44DRAFT_733650 [Phaeosphaeriaceae sp. PMI808]